MSTPERFSASDRVVFVSDVHLYYAGEDYLRSFLDFLRDVAAGARALYIHGDLFDFYVGPRQGARPFYARLFAALRALVDAGTPCTLLHGNRDFLVGRCFEQAGVRVVAGELELELGTLRVHLSHGDQFCIHDHSYQFWARRVLRAPPIAAFVKALPVGIAVWLARRYRRISSRRAARHRQAGTTRLETVFDGVRELLRTKRYDAVVCGHIHDWKRTELSLEGGGTTRLFTTGAWEEFPNWIEFVGGDLQLRRWDRPETGGVAAPSAPVAG